MGRSLPAERVAIRGALAVCAAVLLASCAGRSSDFGASPGAFASEQRGAQSSILRTADGKKTPYVYITFSFSSAVDQYNAYNKENDPPLCQIGPINRSGAVNTDGANTLYVSTFSGNNVVETFGADCGKQLAQTYVDTIGSPSDLAVTGKTLYVSNFMNEKGNAANIAVFDVHSQGGQFKPVRQLENWAAGESIGIALDSTDNVFWSTVNEKTGVGQVIEFARGNMPGKILKATQLGQDMPGSVMVDAKNNLLMVDSTKNQVDVFAPPYDKAPFATIPLQGATLRCAMMRSNRRIYCMDYGNAAVDVYAYPQGTYLFSFNNGIQKMAEPLGIAVN